MTAQRLPWVIALATLVSLLPVMGPAGPHPASGVLDTFGLMLVPVVAGLVAAALVAAVSVSRRAAA